MTDLIETSPSPEVGMVEQDLREPFERYPALASWIERLANTPMGLSLGEWCVFVGALNHAITTAEAAKPAASGAVEWRDIASAPRDGTEVLLWASHWRGPAVGWTFGEDPWQGCRKDTHQKPPTHWSPLPPSPSTPPQIERDRSPDATNDPEMDALIARLGTHAPLLREAVPGIADDVLAAASAVLRLIATIRELEASRNHHRGKADKARTARNRALAGLEHWKSRAQTAEASSREPLERLQAIIDWADFALSNPGEFDSHGVRNLDGPVFDEARALISLTTEAAQ